MGEEWSFCEKKERFVHREQLVACGCVLCRGQQMRVAWGAGGKSAGEEDDFWA